jgi:non-ribosomal peptide synthetase component F
VLANENGFDAGDDDIGAPSEAGVTPSPATQEVLIERDGDDIVLLHLELDRESTLASLAFALSAQLEMRRVYAFSDASAAEETSANTFAVSMLPSPSPRLAMCGCSLLLSLPASGTAALLFDELRIGTASAGRLVHRFGVCAAWPAHRPLAEAPMMDAAEARFVAVECNRTAAPFGAHAVVHASFCAAANAHPTCVALVDPHERLELRYAQLDVRSDVLASSLTAQHVLRPACRLVGLVFERSIAMVVAILGVLKAGGGYLPIEPAHPVARVETMLAEATPAAILVADAIHQPATAAEAVLVAVATAEGTLTPLDIRLARTAPMPILPVSAHAAAIIGPMVAPMPVHVGSDDVVYVMYTSGSSGRPKGVVVTHGPLLKRIAWLRRTLPIGAADAVPFKTPFVFGVSEWELFYTLTAGATLIVCGDAIVRTPKMLASTVAPCALLFLVPSHLDMLLHVLRADKGPWRLRHVICCGEALLPSTVDKFHEAVASRVVPTDLHNVYGPTEASMTHHVCVQSAPEVLIGGPIDNTTVRDDLAFTHTPVWPTSVARCTFRRCGFSTRRRAGWHPSGFPPRFVLRDFWQTATSASPS